MMAKRQTSYDKWVMAALVLIPLRTFAVKFIFNVLMAHVLSVALYSDFIIALKAFFLFIPLILLGTHISSTRFLALHLNMHKLSTAADYIRWNINLIIRSSAILIAGLILLLGWMAVLHYLHLKDFHSYHLTIYLLFLAPLGAVATLLAAYLASNNDLVLYNLLYNSACYGLFIVLTLIVVHWCHAIWSYASLWWLTLAVFTLLTLIEMGLIYWRLPHRLMKVSGYIRQKHANLDTVLWQKISLRLCFNQLVFSVLCVVDLYAVRFYVSDDLATNQYAALLTISSLIWLMGAAIYSKIGPAVSVSLKNQQFVSLRRTVYYCHMTNLVGTTSIGLLLIYCWRTWLGFFGQVYVTMDSYWALLILVLGYYLGTFANVSIAILKYSGGELWLIYIGLAELTLMVGSAIVLTPRYGMIGAALASSVAIVGAGLASMVLARRKLTSCIG